MHAKLQDNAGWDALRVFLALYRGRSLSAAAQRLGMDTSTVSRRLAGLEQALKRHLFDRTREGLVPTQAAELLLAAAEDAEAGHQRFLRDATELETAPEGLVRLSVPPGVADAFVGPALPTLYARYPKLRIEIDASVRVVDLTRHEADLAIRTIRPQGGDLILCKIASTRWLPMASKKYARELGRLAHWEDARWIDWAQDLASIGPARWFRKHVQSDPVLRTSHFATQLSAIEHGLGIALVPDVYARVRPLFPISVSRTLQTGASEYPTDDTWLVGHRALRRVPRVAAVWDFVVETFGGPPRR